jgi:hypothetical protein
LYRGINDFKKGYQSRINIIKYENGNQVLNVCGVHDVRQMDIHMADPLVPEPSLTKVEIPIGKLKRYKYPGAD